MTLRYLASKPARSLLTLQQKAQEAQTTLGSLHTPQEGL